MPTALQHRGRDRPIKPSFYELPPSSLYDLVFQALCKNGIEIVRGIEPFMASGHYLRTLNEITINYDGSLDTLIEVIATNPQIGAPSRSDEEVLFYDKKAPNSNYYDRVIISLKPIFGR